MAFAIDMFTSYYKLNHPIKIALPNDSMKLVDIIGSVILTPHITLTHELFAPEFKHNLLSVGRLLDQNNLFANFHQISCSFQDLTTNEVKAVGHIIGGLYRFNKASPTFDISSYSSSELVSRLHLDSCNVSST